MSVDISWPMVNTVNVWRLCVDEGLYVGVYTLVGTNKSKCY